MDGTATEVVDVLMEWFERFFSAPKVGVSGVGDPRVCEAETGDAVPMSGEESGKDSGMAGTRASEVVDAI